MTTIHINNFGGLIPRNSERALPPGAAQENRNLLATSSEFRPVMEPSFVAAAVSGAISMYRRQRDLSGNFLQTDSEGWFTANEDINFVRGQINDDTTERTYLSFNDGTRPPTIASSQIINSSYVNYLLGIPAPAKPAVALLAATRFGAAEANAWLASSLVPAVSIAIAAALKEDQLESRFTDPSGNRLTTGGIYGSTIAGVTSFDPSQYLPGGGVYEYFPKYPTSQRASEEPWNIMMRIPAELVAAEGIGNPQVGGVFYHDPADNSNPLWIGVAGLPLWGVLDGPKLFASLAAIQNPRNFSEGLWSVAQQDKIVNYAAEMFSRTGTAVLQKRRALDDAVREFTSAAAASISAHASPVVPVPPTPVGEQFFFSGSGDAATQTVNPDWATWKLLNDEYLISKAQYDRNYSTWKSTQAAYAATMVAAQKKCADLSHDIEQLYVDLKTNLPKAVANYFNSVRLSKTEDESDGLVVIDSSNLADARFYITTWVSEFGEESAPSPPSDLVTVNPCDVVMIARQTPPASSSLGTRSITKWRIYRSNTGNVATSFQFVAEVPVAQAILAPTTAPVGSTEGIVTGMTLTHKWRDVVANWQIYTARGETGTALSIFTDTTKLRIGDKATQTRDATYSVTKVWNGAEWTMESVPDVTSLVGQLGYLDGRKSSQLGEVCPTVTWLEPPKVLNPTTGATTYLKGLVGMPNGIMAGFIDNFIAFCEPYKGYAWPVEYQIPIEFPVVGLCTFGQSILVGTMANPYIISGSDSASMSSQKLDQSQSCVSRRSMVANQGGVFYASPDGYCYASQAGVEVVTQGLFAREDWQKLKPSSIFAVIHDNVVYFWTNDGTVCFGMDMVAKKLTRHDIVATAVFDDVVSDSVYIARSGQVARLFSPTASRATGIWKSGMLTSPLQSSLGWAQIMSKYEAGNVDLEWWADGSLRHSVAINSIEPVRLPPGRYLEHEVVVKSKNRITSVTMAGSLEELKSI